MLIDDTDELVEYRIDVMAHLTAEREGELTDEPCGVLTHARVCGVQVVHSDGEAASDMGTEMGLRERRNETQTSSRARDNMVSYDVLPLFASSCPHHTRFRHLSTQCKRRLSHILMLILYTFI